MIIHAYKQEHAGLFIDLVKKKKQLDDKKILEAYHASSKTSDEILEFLKSGEK